MLRVLHKLKPKISLNFINNKFIRFYSAETIYSLSSGHGKCGVSVIRVSGPNTMTAMKHLIGENFKPKPRYAALKSVYHPKTQEMIDKGLVLWFPGPNSFTGENSCEFQVHGSVAVIAAIMDALSSVPDLRAAKPGEFTKRAFFNGKLDLTEVDGLADLIHSETEAQRKQALLQSTGALSKLYSEWRKKIIRNIAHLEAFIDFAEDENIEDNTLETINLELQKLKAEIKNHLNDHRQGELLRDGIRTVIIGAPNVGKSSFINIICQRQISIVTSIAGTTRDIIESSFNIGGYPVVFADTAGLRIDTNDTIEAEGINRAKDYIKTADFIILLLDAKSLAESLSKNVSELNYLENYLGSLGIAKEYLVGRHILKIANKIDLLADTEMKELKEFKDLKLISCKNNENIDNVLDDMKMNFQEMCGQPSPENPRLTQSRYRESLTECLQHLEDFLQSNSIPNSSSLDANQDLAILAQKLRHAVRCIERITGHVSTDEILDVIFKDFCIGK